MSHDHLVTNEAFSVATLIYARLRRVLGRVIDVIYLSENIEYAKNIIEIATATEDPELLKLIERFKLASNFDLSEPQELSLVDSENATLALVEPNDEDIYRAQVSHHYIGALR